VTNENLQQTATPAAHTGPAVGRDASSITYIIMAR